MMPQSKTYLSRILFFLLLLSGSSQACFASDVQYMRGLSCYKDKNYSAAEKCFQASLKANPNNVTAMYYEGLCYCNNNEHDQAKKMFRQIVERFPQSQEAKLCSAYLSQTAQPRAQTSANSQPAASRQAAQNNLPDEVSIPFSKGFGGHLLIDGALNGRRMRMYFDTGANNCVFGRNSLIQAGVSETGSRDAGFASGVGGQVKVKQMLASVEAGNLSRQLPVLVQNNLDTPLLGQPFYEGYSYDIDNNAGIIRFKKIGSRSQSQSFDSVEVPYTEQGSSHIFVEAEINGGRRFPTCFDTGAGGGITMSALQAMALGINIPQDATPMRVGGVAGESMAVTFNARTVRVGPLQKTNCPVTVLQGNLPFPLIGEDFFGQRTYTIDKAKKVIRFSR